MITKRTLLNCLLLCMLFCAAFAAGAQNIRYVDSSKVTSGDGTTWAQAYKTVHEALVAANASSTINQVWIRKGTYYPTAYMIGSTNNSSARDYTFALKNNLAIYGGFAGTETAIGQRVPGNTTVLSGDIGTPGAQTDNCYHVVVSADVNYTAVLNGVTITQGYADGNQSSNLGIQVFFRRYGGGMYNSNASPSLSNCIFLANTSAGPGGEGGGLYNSNSSPTINNCIFSGNTASNPNGGPFGGGICNVTSSPAITNCLFVSNTATGSSGFGGAIANQNSSPAITNCTFNANGFNGSGGFGSDISNAVSSPVIANAILWGNTSGFPNIYNDNGSTPTISNSIVQGGYNGTGNLNAAPLFVTPTDPDGADNIFGTADDGLKLLFGSPAINAGNNAAIPPGTPTDLTGAARIQATTVDMGAYEGGICPSNTIIYVDSSVAASGNGTTWAGAKKTLQEALSVANSCNSITQVWVRKGTYYPTAYPAGSTGLAGNLSTLSARDYAFVLKNNLAIYGGFAGTETAIGQRVPGNTTILSGDIGTPGVHTDNCYHVILSINVNSTAILNGLTITRGNASGGNPNYIGSQAIYNFYGGGMSNRLASPSITNCIFVANNSIGYGGGMYNDASSPNIINCIFSGNTAANGNYPAGGGMCNYGSSPAIVNCLFISNAASYGGGIFNDNNTSPTITNCTFSANTASENGSAIRNSNASPVITNSVFWGNTGSGSTISAGSTTTVSNSIVQGGYTGTGNLNADPFFVTTADPDGADNIFGTADDGLRLQFGSPAINAGSNASVPASNTTDLAGATRIQLGTVDMGAYETGCPAATLYVDSSIANPGNGSSWALAIKELRTAVSLAQVCSGVTTIHVAKGTYKPTTNTSRDSTFAITRGGLKIYGGYPSGGGTRNIAANPTVLSGDIGTLNNATDNSYHVVVVAGLTATADSLVIDGFTVTGGKADGPATPFTIGGQAIQRNEAAGIYLHSNANGGKLTLRNCTVAANSTNTFGGGLYIRASAPFVDTCAINNNAAADGGGIFCFDQATPLISRTIISGNTATVGGGIQHRSGGKLSLVGCRVLNNTATAGGALRLLLGDPGFTARGCVFAGNQSTGNDGGALSLVMGSTGKDTIINCVFARNKATGSGGNGGGAIVQESGAATYLVNNTFFADSAGSNSGAIRFKDGGTNRYLYNNLFYKNYNGTDTTSVSYATGTTATGQSNNLFNANPIFPDEANLTGPDGKWGTIDDGLRLFAGSPALNAGLNSAVAGIATDLAGAARIQATTVDIGAYEGTVYFRLYVDSSVAASGNGSSWGSALKTLQEALDIANPNKTVKEIWVKEGTYYPTGMPYGASLASPDFNDYSFGMVNGVAIYGGFGGADTTFALRNFNTHKSILSGDVGTQGYQFDNCGHVVVSAGNDTTAILDGFTITGGNQLTLPSLTPPTPNYSVAVTLLNAAGVPFNTTCSIEAVYGGGIYFSRSNGVVRNCTISDCHAGMSGPGVACKSESKIKLYNCLFERNKAGGFSGVVSVETPNSTCDIDRCIFYQNMATPILYLTSGAHKITNSIFCNNPGPGSTAGGLRSITCYGGYLDISNCTFLNSPQIELYGSGTSNMSNSIVWRDTLTQNSSDEPGFTGNSGISLSNNLIRVGYNYGPNTLYTDPVFVNPNNVKGNDGIWGTADDGLRLAPTSPAVNAGTNTGVPSGITSDLSNSPRIQQSTVDLGAYESPYNNYCTILTGNPAVLYVDSSISNSGIGTTWSTAFKTLQEAIEASATFTNDIQIWVKKGTYYPTKVPWDISLLMYTNPEAMDTPAYAFRLKNKMAIYGGFAGNETSLSQRNPGINTTVLSSYKTAGNSYANTAHIVFSKQNDSTAIVDGFVFNCGREYYSGGSVGLYDTIYNNNSSGYQPVGQEGLAIYIKYGSPTIRNCVFSFRTSPVTYYYNSSNFGSIYCQGSSPNITNCLFTSSSYGNGIGIICNNGHPKVRSSTFYGQSTSIKDAGSATTIENSILWDNTPVNGGSPVITYSTVRGGYTGTGNISASPLFADSTDADGPDNKFATADDGLMPGCTSPALNSGTATGAPSTDIVGTARPVGSGVDMGAYERASLPPVDSVTIAASTTSICPGQPVTFTATPVNGGATPAYQWLKNGAVVSGATMATFTPATISSGDIIKAVMTSSLTCVAPLSDTSNAITINAAASVTPSVSIAADNAVACPGSAVTFTATPVNGGSTPAYQWKKNNVAIGGATGSTYTTGALTGTDSFSVVLTSSATCAAPTTATSNRIGLVVYGTVLYVDSSVVTSGNGASWTTPIKELRAALLAARQCSGIIEVYVARGTYKPTASTARDSTFLINRGGLKIYGGYPSGGGARNIVANPTVLSGDIGNANDSTDNSYHVVVAAGLPASADSLVIDGLTITNGNANGGGGLNFNVGTAYHNEGGGLYLHSNANGGKVALRHCTFSRNASSNYGGGFYNQLSSPTVEACVIVNNTSGQAGGMFCFNQSSPHLANTLIAGNRAINTGGGMLNWQSSTPTIINTTITANSAGTGGAMFNDGVVPVIESSILWDNTANASPGIAGSAAINSSIVQGGGYTTGGNINADPLFVNAADPDGADNIFGTADDGIVPAYCSPAINGGNSAVAGTDLTGAPRTMFTTADMGAYEKQTAAPSDIADQAALSAASANALPFVKSCDDGTWTYYAIPGNLDSMGFAIAWGTNTAAKNAATVSIKVDANNPGQTSATAGIWAMRRYWNVSLNGHSLSTPVQVRFYYNASDTIAMSQAAAASGLAPASPVKWFKTIGTPYSPSLLAPDTINASYTLLTPAASGVENMTAWVQFDSITSFSGGTALIGTGTSSTLPVDLLAFGARKSNDGQSALLTWDVANEHLLREYGVERSGDGATFQTIGTVAASAQDRYEYLDAKPLAGTNYYRLSMVDWDGAYRYSSVRILDFATVAGPVVVSPNPAHDRVQISTTDAALVGTEATILSTAGQLVARFTVALTQTVSVADWAAGIYLLRMADGQVIRIVKQ